MKRHGRRFAGYIRAVRGDAHGLAFFHSFPYDAWTVPTAQRVGDIDQARL